MGLGSLKVFVNDGSDHVVFSKSGDQLNQWHFAKFDIDSSASYKVGVCQTVYGFCLLRSLESS